MAFSPMLISNNIYFHCDLSFRYIQMFHINFEASGTWKGILNSFFPTFQFILIFFKSLLIPTYMLVSI
jgi:hypothetical protein